MPAGAVRSSHASEGLPFSIDWLPDGRLVATTSGGVVVGPDLASYGAPGQPFNEIVVDAAGRAWVDMPGSMPWEESKPGIVAVVLPDGTSHQVADDVWFPNGLVVLGDDTLVLAESHADRLTAWTITDDGELTDRRVWAELGPGSAPDGICADADGAIWYASVPGKRCTRVAEGGEVLDTVERRSWLLLVHARWRRRSHALHRGQPLRRQRRIGRHRADPAGRRPPRGTPLTPSPSPARARHTAAAQLRDGGVIAARTARRGGGRRAGRAVDGRGQSGRARRVRVGFGGSDRADRTPTCTQVRSWRVERTSAASMTSQAFIALPFISIR